MNAKWAAALAAALLFVGGALYFLQREDAAPAPAPAEPPPPKPALRDQRPSPPPAAPPVPGDPVPETNRVLPYRPAKLLKFSEDEVATDPARDGAQPALQRLLRVTQADPQQIAEILRLWRVHEDGRRELASQVAKFATAARVLDPQKQAELDVDFSSSVYALLRATQRQRLAEETGEAQLK